jgi:phage-related tail fiber protein
VQDCVENELSKTGLTAANAERANKFEFTITPKDDNTANVVSIPATVVKSNGCSTTTVMEYWNPQTIQWEEGREKDGHVTFTYDADGVMTVAF